LLKPRSLKKDKPSPTISARRAAAALALPSSPQVKSHLFFFYQFGGRKRRMTIGRYPHCSLADAKCIHRDALTLLESGKDPALDKRTSEQEARGAPIIANRTLATIRRMFNFAIERDIIPHSPCVMVKAVAKENRRDRCLSETEIKTLWLALDHPQQTGSDDIKMSEATKLALKLQLVKGQRKGEIVRIEWSDIQIGERWWTIPAIKAKNGVLTRVYLSDLAMTLLARVKELSGTPKWAFPAPNSNTHITPDSISRAINRSTFEELEHFTPHDLRRSAATHMCGMGIPRLVVSKILNHVDNSITAIYDRHSYDTEKKNALEAWSKKLTQIISPDRLPNNVPPPHLKNKSFIAY